MTTLKYMLFTSMIMGLCAGLDAADPDPGGGNANPCECESDDWDPGLSATAEPSEFVLDLATGQTITFSASAEETAGPSGDVGPEDCEMPDPEIDAAAPSLDGWEHENGSGSSYDLVIAKGDCPPDSMTYEYSFSPTISSSDCPGVVGTEAVTATATVTKVILTPEKFEPFEHLWPKCLDAPVALDDFLIVWPEGTGLCPGMVPELQGGPYQYDLVISGEVVASTGVTRHQKGCGEEWDDNSLPAQTNVKKVENHAKIHTVSYTSPTVLPPWYYEDRYHDFHAESQITGAWRQVRTTGWVGAGNAISIIKQDVPASGLTVSLTFPSIPYFGSISVSYPLGGSSSVQGIEISGPAPKRNINVMGRAYDEPLTFTLTATWSKMETYADILGTMVLQSTSPGGVDTISNPHGYSNETPIIWRNRCECPK